MSWSTPRSAKVVNDDACPAVRVRLEVSGSTPFTRPQARGSRSDGGDASTYRASVGCRERPRRGRVVALWRRGQVVLAAPRPGPHAAAALARRSRRRDARRLRRTRARADTLPRTGRLPAAGLLRDAERADRARRRSSPRRSRSRGRPGAALTKHRGARRADPRARRRPHAADAAVPRVARRLPPQDARRAPAGDDALRAHHGGHARRLLPRAVVELRRHRAPRRRASCRPTTTARRSSTSSRTTIESDEEWRSLLALWGRRLVGDTLLVAAPRCGPRRSRAPTRRRSSPSSAS